MAISKRELDKVKCRENILKESRRLFNKKGYENTKIEEIAIASNISNATFYNYFPTKESLLVGTAEDVEKVLINYIDNELKSEKDYAKAIRLFIKYMIIDIHPFASLSRKMNYLNACKNSVMYDRMQMRRLISNLVSKAQEHGFLSSDYSTSLITEIYMSIFLIAIFDWKDFDEISNEECANRIDSYLDAVLSNIEIKKA